MVAAPTEHLLDGVSPAEYPFSPRFHTLPGGHQMAYLDEGDPAGHPVVMVHGNPTWSYFYRHLIRGLGDSVRSIAVDHIGCGHSDKPGDDAYDYTLSQRVDDLERLLDELVPEGPVTLVLHDWGGMIGMSWAARHPERVARLVLMNTAAFHLPETKRFPLRLWLARDTGVGSLLVNKFNAFSRAATHFCVTEKMSPEVARGYEAPYASSQADRIATLRFVQDIPLKPADRAYPVVTATQDALPTFADRPILIAWGYKDFVFDVNFLARWKEIYPDARFIEYPDAGHYILEDRRDDLIPQLVDFIQEGL